MEHYFCIATTSAIKLAAVQRVLDEYIPEGILTIRGVETESGVPRTPWNEEGKIGAENRAHEARVKITEATYWVGLESALVEREGMVIEESWCCLIDASKKHFFGISSALSVPQFVLDTMKKEGLEHYKVMNSLRANPDDPKDTWGDYTGGVLLREVSLEEAFRNALIQVIAPEKSYYLRSI